MKNTLFSKKGRADRYISIFALVIVIVVAAYWRLTGLAYRAMWYDEVEVVRAAARDTVWDVILAARSHASAPPIDYILRHFWQLAGGVDDAWLRTYSNIIGVLTVAMTYGVGKRLHGRWAALLAALCLAVSSFHVFYSAEVKFYALLALSYATTYWMWLQFRESGKIRHGVLFGVAGLLGAYVHPYVMFIVGFCALASVISWVTMQRRNDIAGRGRNLRQLLPFAAAVLIVMAYIPLVVWDFLRQEKGWSPPTMNITIALATFRELMPEQVVFPLVAAVGLVVAVVDRSRRQVDRLPLWGTIVAAPFLVYGLDVYGHYPFFTKQLVFVQPLLLIAIAGGIVRLFEIISRRILTKTEYARTLSMILLSVSSIAVGVFGSVDVAAQKTPTNWQWENWRTVARWLAENTHPDDVILWGAQGQAYSVIKWYLERSGLLGRSMPLVEQYKGTPITYAKMLDFSSAAGDKTTWLFGKEVERVFKNKGLRLNLRSTQVGTVDVYRIAAPEKWRLDLNVRAPLTIAPGQGFQKIVHLPRALGHILSMSFEAPKSDPCNVTVSVDDDLSASADIDASGPRSIELMISPREAEEAVLRVQTSCEVELRQAQLSPLPVIATSDTGTLVDDVEMTTAAKVNRQLASNGRTQTWLYRSNDSLESVVWISDTGTYDVFIDGMTFGEPFARAMVIVGDVPAGVVEFGSEWISSTVQMTFWKPGPQRIGLRYLNDTSKRDLLIDALRITPSAGAVRQRFVPIDMNLLAAGYRGGVELTPDGVLGMYWEGRTSMLITPTAEGPVTVRVIARGQQGCDAWPNLGIGVGETPSRFIPVSSAGFGIVEFENVVVRAGVPQSLMLEFRQPRVCAVKGQDINLFVQDVVLVVKDGTVAMGKDVQISEPAPTPVNPQKEDENAAALDLSRLAAGYRGGAALSDQGDLQMYWTGAASAEYPELTPGRYDAVVEARGRSGCGIWPDLLVTLDGTAIATRTVDSDVFETYTFPELAIDAKSPRRLGVAFRQAQDCTAPNEDVDLFIRRVRLEPRAP